MIWNAPAETMPREDLVALQLARLQALARRVYERVPFYRAAFDRAGVAPEQIRSLQDLRRLPRTRKTDLGDHSRSACLAGRPGLRRPEHQ